MPIHSENRLASWRAYGAKRRADPQYRERQKELNRVWHERHRDDSDVLRRKAKQMKGYSNDPRLREKHEARWAVNRAIAAGRLKKMPCKCGSVKVEAHHEDYSQPLEVMWMCRPCHTEWHAKATGQGSGA